MNVNRHSNFTPEIGTDFKRDLLAVSFCNTVAAWAKNMFSNFYVGKNRNNVNISTATAAREIEIAQIWI
jgi:hypothetical protein